jgi:AcrR family transcriptional regulator
MARRSTPTPTARLRFLDAGLAVLGEHGHAGLKLATVCERAGTTTGSFYHAFPNWADFTSALIRYWREDFSRLLIEGALHITDPRERLDRLVEIGLQLDPDSEAAIRVWAAHEPQVLAHLTDVDAARHAVIRDTYRELLDDPKRADDYAAIAMYLLIGFQSGTIRSPGALATGFTEFLAQTLGEQSESRG